MKPDAHVPLPAAGTIQIYSNLACPRAHSTVHELLRLRREHGLDSTTVIEHQPLPFEAIRFPRGVDDPWDAAVEEARSSAPEAGWHSDAPPPRVSTRNGHEAVQAAKAQGASASVDLDRALRIGLFRDHIDISDQTAVQDVAVSAAGLDLATLRSELESGRAASEVRHRLAQAATGGVEVSPTIVESTGTAWAAPDPGELEEILLRSAAAVAAE